MLPATSRCSSSIDPLTERLDGRNQTVHTECEQLSSMTDHHPRHYQQMGLTFPSIIQKPRKKSRSSCLWYYLQTPLGIVLLTLLSIYLLWTAYQDAAERRYQYDILDRNNRILCGYVSKYIETGRISCHQINELQQIVRITGTKGPLTYKGVAMMTAMPSSNPNLLGFEGYNHTIRILERPLQQSPTLHLQIKEERFGVPTSGGSNFRMLVSGRNSLDMCTIEDWFNGNYLCACPIHEDSVSVQTHVMFIGFSAFKQPGSDPLDKQIGNNVDIHINDTHLGKQQVNVITCKEPEPEIFTRSMRGTHWVRRGARWLMVHKDQCLKPLPPKERIMQKLSQYHSISFIGDTVISSTHGFVNDIISSNGSKSQPILNTTKMHYSAANSIKDLTAMLTNTHLRFITGQGRNQGRNQGRIKSSKDLILFGAGSLDLQMNNVSAVLGDAESLITALKQITHERPPQKLRLIWLSIMPQNRHHSQGSNYYYTSALNAWINQRIKTLGVEIIDFNQLIYPVANLNTGDDMYDCLNLECKRQVDENILGGILYVMCK